MLSVSQDNNGPYVVNDDVALHTYTDAADMRRFVLAYQALRATFPLAVFTLADDAHILTWSGPDAQPADVATVVTAYQAAQTQAAQDAAALRQHIVTVAQGAVGQSIDTLTAAQVRALVACLLYKAGAIDKVGVVQPLGGWL